MHLNSQPSVAKKIEGEKFYFRPAIPICLALMAGIWLANLLPGGDIWALGVALCGTALILRRVGKGDPAGKLPLALIFALGYFSLQPYVDPILPNRHVIHFADGKSYEITGRVVSEPLLKNGRQKAVLKVESLGIDHDVLRVEGLLNLTVYGQNPSLNQDDRIRFGSRIREIRNFKNPGGFDYERHMAFQGIRASTYCRAEKVHRLSTGVPEELPWGLGRRRSEAARMIEASAAGRSDTQAVLAALLIGRKETISNELKARFNRCGVGHLLAISGLHVGIVALTAFWAFTKIFAFVPMLLWRGIGRRLAAVSALIPVVYYGALAGFSPSTQRAVLMVAVLLGGYMVGRKGDIFNTLAWAAVVILILHPPTLFSVSFQLSFGAVLAIVSGMRRFNPVLTWMKGAFWVSLLRRVYQMMLVSCFALLGTLPFTMYYFNHVSLLGPLANLILIPLLGFTAVPVGLLGIFTSPISSSLAALLLSASAHVVSLALAMIEFMADLPWASLRTFTPSHIEITLYFLFLALLFKHKEVRIGRSALWGLLLLFSLDVCFWTQLRFFDSRIKVTALDVGQGSATLVELPRGKTVLVDGGGFSNNANFDVGARIVAPFLWRRKIQTVDLMVLTHPNSDHLNGLLYVLDNFNVRKVWSTNETADTLAYHHFRELLSQNKVRHPDFNNLPRKWRIGDVTLNILNPPKDPTHPSENKDWSDSNNNSLVLKLSYGDQSLLLAGDLMRAAESALLKRYPSERLRSTILLTPHHGSKSSSSPKFVAAVHPEFALMAAGWHNPFGFPHEEVLQRYQKIGANILRTDQCGAVQLVLDGNSVAVTTTLPCREAPERPEIRLAVPAWPKWIDRPPPLS